MNAICHAVNLDGVVVLFGGGGNPTTLHAIIKLFALRSGEDTETQFWGPLCPLHPFVSFMPFTPIMLEVGEWAGALSHGASGREPEVLSHDAMARDTRLWTEGQTDWKGALLSVPFGKTDDRQIIVA